MLIGIDRKLIDKIDYSEELDKYILKEEYKNDKKLQRMVDEHNAVWDNYWGKRKKNPNKIW